MSDLRYDATVAARDVEVRLDVAAGETVALLGPNGAGKSTVLAVVAGLLRPTSGTVSLGGRALDAVPPHERRVALLAQEALLFPHLSVLDNVAFGPRSAGARRGESRRAARTWLQHVGVDDLAGRRPQELSGGQAQRVAVARALAAEPELLLLDEPMAALDVAVTPALRQALRTVLADRTVVLVTHDPLDALVLADRVVVLEGGRVVEAGPTREVLTRPRSAFAARAAGLNRVAGTWQGGAVVDAGVAVHARADDPAPHDGDAVVAIFSPSSVQVLASDARDRPGTGWEAEVADVETLGDRVRVRTVVGRHVVAAELTTPAAAALDLTPGAAVHLVVAPEHVTVLPAARA